MTLALAQQALAAALATAAPSAEVLDTRGQPLLTALSTSTFRGGFRQGALDGPVHTIDCTITASGGRFISEAAYDAVSDQMAAFVAAIKDTEPGGWLIFWPEGITVDFAEERPEESAQGSAKVIATAHVPICERYPRNG